MTGECVYILSIEPPLAHAKFYVGYTQRGLASRLAYHLSGRGCKLIAAAVAAGRTVRPVLIIPGGNRTLERRIKNRKETPRLVAQALRTGKLYGYEVQQ